MSAKVSWKKPLLLAIALTVLGTGTYWFEFQHKPRKEEAKEQSKKLFSLKEVSIASIRLVDGNRSFTFNCLDVDAKLCKPDDHSKWEMIEPSKLRADDSNVNALLSALEHLNSSEVFDLGTDTEEKRAQLLKEYGLDPQTRKAATARRVEIKTASGESRVAYFGAYHPIGDGMFTLSGDNEHQVYLIPSYFKNQFDHDLTYWRNKKLLTLGASDVRSFQLEGASSKLEAEKKEGKWILRRSGQEVSGDAENIDRLLSGAAFLTAKGFASEDKKDGKAKSTLSGAKKLLSLTLRADQTSEPVVLEMYEKRIKTTPSLYATVSNLDPLYELELAAKDKLNKDWEDLRLLKLITSMERFGAKRLEFSGEPIGKDPLILVQSDSKWIKKDDQKEIEREKAQGLLDRISGNRIKKFLTGKAVPAGESTGLHVVIGDEKNEKKRQLVFWKKGEDLYARDLQSGRSDEAFLIDSEVKNALPWSRSFFDKKTE